MFTIDIVFYVLVGTTLVSIASAVLGILGLRASKKQTAQILEFVQGQVGSHRQTTLARINELAGVEQGDRDKQTKAILDDLSLKIQNCRDTNTHQTNVKSDEVQAALKPVEAHLAQYSAVMESQDRLIKAVGALVENVESPVRKHR